MLLLVPPAVVRAIARSRTPHQAICYLFGLARAALQLYRPRAAQRVPGLMRVQRVVFAALADRRLTPMGACWTAAVTTYVLGGRLLAPRAR